MEIKRKEKSRSIGIYDYFKALQLEWIIADLRLRLYPKPKDKEFWKKVRDGKKITIESIADKNTLPTIFTDDEMLNDFNNMVFRQQSYPNFFYKDDNNKNSQGYYDLLYYYAKGADVRCNINGEIKVGKVKTFNPIEKHMMIKLLDESEVKVHIDEVTRIL